MPFLNQSVIALQAIIHLGACSDTSQKDMSYLIKNNYAFSIDLFLFAKKSNTKFIYASSAATYGLGENSYDDDHHVLKKLRPLNPYGFSKHLFDLWLLDNNYLNDAVGLKYFNIFGSGELHKQHMMSLVAKAFFQIKENGTLKLFKSNSPEYKDGEQLRDFLYVKDAAKITVNFLWNNANGIFNVGSGKAQTWLELAESVFLAMNKEKNIEFIDIPESLSGQYQNYTKANTEKLSKYYSLQDIYSLKDAVFEYVNQYLT
jgi:ADP-L-glycero-D-manno-heptose 6-epimerase